MKGKLQDLMKIILDELLSTILQFKKCSFYKLCMGACSNARSSHVSKKDEVIIVHVRSSILSARS